MTIVSGVVFLALFFFLPETQYPRTSTAQAPFLQSSSSEDQSEPPKQKDETTVEENLPVAIPAKKTYLQQLKPWSGINPNGQKASFFSLFIRSWPLVFYPAVAFSTLVFGLAVSDILIAVGTSASVFQGPPYNMSPGIQSLIFLFLMGGALIGAAFGGKGTDIYAKYRSSKNDGVFEPESRLVLLIGPLLIVPSGLLMCVSPLKNI